MLHVANGHATTALIERAALAGRSMVWADALYDGPVPGDVSDEELLRVRAAFLASSPEGVNAVLADLQGWRSSVDDQHSYDELVLWFEHDLFDQLNLIQLLTHLGQRDRVTPVTIVTLNQFPGHPYFKGLGELAPADIASLWKGRVPVTEAQFALAPRAWAAFRSADPRAIDGFLSGDTTALPFLAAAFRRHLQEFPSDRDGLSRSERRMMELAHDAPIAIGRAFAQMSAGENAYYITDRTFVDRARELSSTMPPLLELKLDDEEQRGVTQGTMQVTETGRDVLNGKADRIRLCGVDRWLGGAHVDGRGPTWRWSERAGCVIEA